jgi:hypothetical protein
LGPAAPSPRPALRRPDRPGSAARLATLVDIAAETGIPASGLGRQLEDATGTTLLRTGPDENITLTLDGEQFARDVAPVLDMLAANGH